MRRISTIFLLLFAWLGAGPLPGAEAETMTWVSTQRTIGGRTYFYSRPGCAPATTAVCRAYLTRPRPVIFFLHGATGAEDAATAAVNLNWFHGMQPDTLFVYGVSQGGSRLWDGGICCTAGPVDETGYLLRVLDDLALQTPVDRTRVAAFGFSNGAMTAVKAACERPDAFAAAASLAGTFAGSCSAGVVTLRQWHGDADTTVPVLGGTVVLFGKARAFPAASTTAARTLPGSSYTLDVLPGVKHAIPGSYYKSAVLWLTAAMAP